MMMRIMIVLMMIKMFDYDFTINVDDEGPSPRRWTGSRSPTTTRRGATSRRRPARNRPTWSSASLLVSYS